MGHLTLHISFQAETTLGHIGIPHLALRGKSPTGTSFQGCKIKGELFFLSGEEGLKLQLKGEFIHQ